MHRHQFPRREDFEIRGTLSVYYLLCPSRVHNKPLFIYLFLFRSIPPILLKPIPTAVSIQNSKNLRLVVVSRGILSLPGSYPSLLRPSLGPPSLSFMSLWLRPYTNQRDSLSFLRSRRLTSSHAPPCRPPPHLFLVPSWCTRTPGVLGDRKYSLHSRRPSDTHSTLDDLPRLVTSCTR